mgnify:CR=1 FL=1
MLKTSVGQMFSDKDVLSRLKELYVPGTKYYEELKQRIGYRKLIDSFFETEVKTKYANLVYKQFNLNESDLIEYK